MKSHKSADKRTGGNPALVDLDKCEECNNNYTGGFNMKKHNKLCHIIFGNRTNIGYKYFSWNCDRALLQQKKIEDIKLIANRHKPHFMGISEVDLKRNENNNDLRNNNEMSTEQLHDKFNIEGYNIILPDSWIKHNKARIFIYVNNKLNAKIINLKDN